MREGGRRGGGEGSCKLCTAVKTFLPSPVLPNPKLPRSPLFVVAELPLVKLNLEALAVVLCKKKKKRDSHKWGTALKASPR